MTMKKTTFFIVFHLRNFLDKTFEYVSILFNFPKDRIKRLVKDFVYKMKGN